MKKIILLFVSLSIMTILYGQVSKSLTITAGGLSAALTVEEKSTVTNLTLKGTADARDFKIMRDEMPALSVVNMGATTVAAYSGTQGPSGSRSTVYPASTIPNYSFYSSVTGYGKSGLSTFIFPANITTIGVSAFRKCGLTSVTIPSSVTTIADNAFSTCPLLAGILTIPTSVTSLGEGVFENCAEINSVTISAKISSIEKRLFSGCLKITSVTIPSMVTSIGDSAFNNCRILSSVNLPSSLITIGERAFYSCNLIQVSIPSGVISIGDESFMNCMGLSIVNIPASVTYIGKSAFIFFGLILPYVDLTFNVDEGNQFYSSLDGILFDKAKSTLIQFSVSEIHEYTIPSTVTTIGDYAFANCRNLYSVTIPLSVDSIGDYAFAYAEYLFEIIVFWQIPLELGYEVFRDVSIDCKLLVPYGSKNAYRGSYFWYEFNIEEGSDFSISNHNVTLADTANSNASVEVVSMNTWIASSDQPWLQISPTTAPNGTVQLTMTAQSNYGIERSANVIVITTNVIDTIRVIQSQLKSTILSSTTCLIASNANSSATVDVTSTYTWIASSDQPWLTVDPITPSTGNGIITLTALENTGSVRTATVTVIAQGSLQTIVVTQEAGNETVVGILENEKVILFPNPTSRGFFVKGTLNRATVFLSDLSGRLLLKKELLEEEMIDISTLSKGIYIVNIVSLNEKVEKKLVKE
jgi:hypothetical protein